MHLEIITKKPDTPSSRPPLLLIHGAWHGAWCWEWFQSHFAELGYESHAMSLRGHGKSQVPPRFNWTSISDYVDDVAEVAKRFSEPPVLVGHSMGGLIIQKYLEQHAARAAVLVASVPMHGVYRMLTRIAMKHPWQAFKCVAFADLDALVATPEMAHEALFSDDVPQDTFDHCFAALQPESYRAGLDMLLFGLPRPGKVKVPPMLVLGGERDHLFHPDEIEKTARAYNVKAEIFPAIAHNMPVEREWRKVSGLIVEWLNQNVASRGN